MADWRSLPRKPRPDLAERNRQNATHGLNGSPTWKSWSAMRQRITNPKSKDFANYGGRGLDMDPRWSEFATFFADMGIKPKRMSLGRINNERGYWPDNCRWETKNEQDNNKRTNRTLEINGETRTLAEWARLAGCTRQAIRYRVEAGWTPEQIISAADRGNRRMK